MVDVEGIVITVSPGAATVNSNQTQHFTATVTGAVNKSVT